MQDEYTPSFSSFFGRGEERSCAFFTAIRADPPAAPEPSVPPAPGAAGTRPAAPMAGEPCCIPALSAMIHTEPPTGPPAPGRIFALPSALFHQRRIRHGAHPYFHFSRCRWRVPPLGDSDGRGRIPGESERRRSRNATIRSSISRSNVRGKKQPALLFGDRV